jgi:hypothetical protein
MNDLKQSLQYVSGNALLLAIIFAVAAFYLVWRMQKQIVSLRLE